MAPAKKHAQARALRNFSTMEKSKPTKSASNPKDARASKPSAAAKVRAALDPVPPSPTDDATPLLERRALIETARPPPRLLSQAQVLAIVPVSIPTLWAMMRRGEFPRSRRLGAGSNRVAWFESEILAWFETLPKQKLKGDAK
jgi:predicted DNA-binding transcriptional regulator AlpA